MITNDINNINSDPVSRVKLFTTNLFFLSCRCSCSFLYSSTILHALIENEAETRLISTLFVFYQFKLSKHLNTPMLYNEICVFYN